jgi:hypothetical protein
MAAQKPRQVLPDVERLHGTQDLDEWVVSIRAKLRIDSEAIGDQYAQFYYVYSRVSADVKKMLLPYVTRAEESDSTAPLQFIEYIRSTFDDPNKVKKAGQRLTKIRQSPRQTIAVYLPLFEQALFTARADSWPDDAKITLLTVSLNKETQERLDRHAEWPDSYDKFLAFLRRQESAFVGASSSIMTSAEDMEGKNGDPMEVDAARISVQGQRRKSRRCFLCDGKDHFARDCPTKSAKASPLKMSTAKLDPSHPAVTDLLRTSDGRYVRAYPAGRATLGGTGRRWVEVSSEEDGEEDSEGDY